MSNERRLVVASGSPSSFRAVQSADVATPELTSAELEALRGAGAWYAKYHAVRIAELSDDPSAYAEGKRESFMTLLGALRKLGFEMAVPDALRAERQRAA